jgi:hypothetical protein
MRYVQSAIAGVAGAVVGMIAGVLLEASIAVITIAWRSRGTGSGGIGVVSSSIPSAIIAIGAVVGFVLAFLWMLRRQAA